MKLVQPMENMVAVPIKMCSGDRSKRIEARETLAAQLDISPEEARVLAHKFQTVGEKIDGDVWVRTGFIEHSNSLPRVVRGAAVVAVSSPIVSTWCVLLVMSLRLKAGSRTPGLAAVPTRHLGKPISKMMSNGNSNESSESTYRSSWESMCG